MRLWRGGQVTQTLMRGVDDTFYSLRLEPRAAEMKESDLNAERRGQAAAQQTFGQHRPRFGAFVRNTIIARRHAAEGPTKSVLERRTPVRIQQVPLEKQGIHQRVNAL